MLHGAGAGGGNGKISPLYGLFFGFIYLLDYLAKLVQCEVITFERMCHENKTLGEFL
jgi:hypothetical protein